MYELRYKSAMYVRTRCETVVEVNKEKKLNEKACLLQKSSKKCLRVNDHMDRYT